MRTTRRFRDGTSFPGVLLAGLAVLVGLAGCDRMPMSGLDEAPEPSFGFEQGPDAPGASPVFRFALPGSRGWILLIDADTELGSLSSGIDGIREGDDIGKLCPGETVEESNPLPFQTVSTRSGIEQGVGTGDLFTWIYDVTGLLPPGFPDAPVADGPFLFFTCEFLTGDAMVAEGLVNSLQTSISSPSGASTTTATGTGRLDDLVHGGQVSTNIKLFVTANAPGDLVRAEVTVDLSPDPRF